MKKIFSLMVVLALFTACGGDEDEALVSDPDVEAGAAADQTLYYVGGDSAFVLESPEPLRFVSSIACVDSCISQIASFRYDDTHRLNQIDFCQRLNGQESRRTTVFRYSPARISYETFYFADSSLVVRKDKGYVLMDKKGRAARGSKMKWTKDSWAGISFSVFDAPAEVLARRQNSRDERWVRCVTDYEYKYGHENDLLQVNQHSRQGNKEFSERSDLMWNVGNLALVSDTHADCAYLYGRVPNKANLDLNRYMTYAFAESSDCTDALLGLLGVYGSRSAQLCTEYTDEGSTFTLEYEVDDDDYVTHIRASRALHEDLYGVNSHRGSAAWEGVGAAESAAQHGPASVDGPSEPVRTDGAVRAAGTQPVLDCAASQQRTFIVTYL